MEPGGEVAEDGVRAIEQAPCDHERAIALALSCPLLPAPPPVVGFAPPSHAPYSRDLIPGPCDTDPGTGSAWSLESPGEGKRLERDIGHRPHG